MFSVFVLEVSWLKPIEVCLGRQGPVAGRGRSGLWTQNMFCSELLVHRLTARNITPTMQAKHSCHAIVSAAAGHWELSCRLLRQPCMTASQPSSTASAPNSLCARLASLSAGTQRVSCCRQPMQQAAPLPLQWAQRTWCRCCPRSACQAPCSWLGRCIQGVWHRGV